MNVSASSIERALSCIPSIILPQSVVLPGRDATRGLSLHEFVRLLKEQGLEAALAATPEQWRADALALDFSRFPGDWEAYAAEVAYGYDPGMDVGRELGRNIGRAYREHGLTDDEVPGTADLVGVTEDAVVVLDWKFGARRATPARDNKQLRFLALAAARAYGKERAHVGLLLHPEGGTPYFDTAELDSLDLDAMGDELRALERARVAALEALDAGTIPPPTVEGEHCRYCPAFANCPAKKNLALSLAYRDEEELPAMLTTELAALAWETIQRKREVMDRAEAQLEDFARGTPFALSSGLVVGEVESEKEELDATQGAIVLAQKYGEQVARSSIKHEPVLQKGLLDKALAAHLKAEPTAAPSLKALKEEALAALEAGGALRRTVTLKVREHRPEGKAAKRTAAKKAKALPEDPPSALERAVGVAKAELGENADVLLLIDRAREALHEDAEPVTDGPGWQMVHCRVCQAPIEKRPPGSSIDPMFCPQRDAHGLVAEGFAPPQQQDAFTAPF